MKLLLMLGLLLISEYLRIEKEKKVRLEKRLNIAKVKIDIELQRKREAFEAFKKHIETTQCEEVYEGYTIYGERVEGTLEELINNDEIEDGSIDVKEVSLEEGVKMLRDNGHKYVPYERVNPLDDLRSSLSEFTVCDVVNTFYI